jgi:hypothetical protein
LFSRTKARLHQENSVPPNEIDNESNLDKAVEQAFDEQHKDQKRNQ